MSVDVAGGVLQPRGSYTASGWGKKFLLLNLSPAVSAVVMTWESVFYSVVYILCTVLSIIRACTSIYNVNTINTYTMLRKKTWKYVCVYVCVEGLHGMTD